VTGFLFIGNPSSQLFELGRCCHNLRMTSPFIEQLAACAALAPSADNSQPWQMRWSADGFELRHVARHPDTNVFGADSHATLLAIGGLAENLDIALAANGVTGQWTWAPAGTQPYARLALPAVLPAGFVAAPGPALRHTNRLPFRATALEPSLTAKVAAATEGAQRIVMLQDSAARKALVRLVRLSSEARFCNRDLHRWLFGSLRETPAEVAGGDGLDVATLGLPPGGKAMLGLMSSWKRMEKLNRFGAYKFLAMTEVGLIAAAPALLCVVGSGQQRDGIEAGRLLTRVWTTLNQQGAAVQPYYVVTDQVNRLHGGGLAAGFEDKIGAVERELHQLLGLAQGEMLHMILRVGYPKATPARSRRLPLPDVFVSAP
jgi:hypothetical protein